MSKKCCRGPGYRTPMDAFKNGAREKLLYVCTVQPNLSEPHGDYLTTVDCDPDSPTYSQIIHRTFTNAVGNELHHSGWNTCSSCHMLDEDVDTVPIRNKLILPSLNTSNIYVVDVGTDPRKPEMFKVIDGQVLRDNNVSTPHSTHCLPNGNVMISTMGDRDDNGKGDFILFDSEFNCVGTWVKPNENDTVAEFGYDFWYQPKFNIMVASEWTHPHSFKGGFNPDKPNGRHLNFYDWTKQQLIQKLDLGPEGVTPLEIRFLHNPDICEGYVGCAVYSNLFHFKRETPDGEFVATKVLDIPAKGVDGWPVGKELNGLMGDIVLSLDDRYLYLNNWLQGDIRQYDISVRDKPRLVGQQFLGGIVVNDSNIKVIDDKELDYQPKQLVHKKGKTLFGGPQMMQLSLDGKRLYVSSCLYSPWDKQFYPKSIEKGGYIVMLNVDIENGGLTVDDDFLIDFANEPYGPTLPHEIRYPGGDCTSDIWLSEE